MVKKLRETISQRKGFTLVELVVVLIILAILAAMLAPSLMGYIDKAKDKRVVAEVHQAVIAAQTLADETYALAEGETPDYAAVPLEDGGALAEGKGSIGVVAGGTATGEVVYASVSLGGVTGYYSEDGGIVSSLTAETAPSDPGETEGYVSFSSEG